MKTLVTAILLSAAMAAAHADETALQSCQSRVDAALARLAPIAGTLVAERGGRLPALTANSVETLRAENRGERNIAGQSIFGEYNDDRRTIKISLATCETSSLDEVMAHELGHAVDFATTARRFSRGVAVMMPAGEKPLSREEAADEYGRRILQRTGNL